MGARSHKGLGLDCIYRDLWVVVPQRCDRLTLHGVWLATGVARLSQRGSLPMQLHRLLTNLHTHVQRTPGANASPSPGVSR